RYGHDVQVLLALDFLLRESPWDILVITGDVSRIGNSDSFEWARNWLETELYLGQTQIGLNLAKATDRHYVVIPGNHDRFNGRLRQSSLGEYYRQFPVIQAGSVRALSVKGHTINFHLFDSSLDGGGFAYGEVLGQYLVPKRLSRLDINIALIH